MPRLAALALALPVLVAGGTAYADTGPLRPGQLSPQVLAPSYATAGVRMTTGGSAVLGRPCTGYSSQVTPPSTIRVYRTRLGRVDVVNFNTYLKNVLPNEWIPSWRTQSLEAGAMAVKTYAWYRVLHWKGGSAGGTCYDIRDDTADQVYRTGSALSATTAAVNATWSTRMLKSGAIFQAQYCSNMYCTYSVDRCGVNANGIRLSQWGSQSCAGSGYDYRRILSRYYSGLTYAPITTG